METTTIQIGKNTKKELDKLKIHPAQPYNEVVWKLIDLWKRWVRKRWERVNK